MRHTEFETGTDRLGRRRSNPPSEPSRVELAHLGRGVFAALVVDSHGIGLEFIEGSERQVLAEIRRRWPGLPVQRLAWAVETEGVNGHRVNPGGEAVRAELAHAGQARWCAIVLDARGAALEVIWGTKTQVLAEIRRRWPDLPVREVPHVRENPAGVPRKEAGQISDRALRYRANADPPPGPRICTFCGSTRNVEVGHLDGYEENSHPSNLVWNCRACNTALGVVFKRLGLGRRTVQFNPAATGAETLGAWLAAVMAMRGASDAMPVARAVAVIRATDPEARSQFAHEIWRLRRARYGPSGRSGSVPF